MRHVSSMEFFSPAALSEHRQASLPSAIFSLVSTIIGGGVLSIPFAFAATGIVLGPIFLVIIALASDFSIYILMSCSRRVEGGKTYEEVVQRAFGGGALLLTVCLLFSLIYLCCVAYLILIRDLLSPIIELITGYTLTHAYRVCVVGVVLLCILPLCLQRSLHALRFTSLTSFLSIVVLAITITYRTIERLWVSSSSDLSSVGVGVGIDAPISGPVPISAAPLKWFSSSWHEAVYAFPIMSVAYLCHFNVLPIHGELIRPTRDRIKSFVNWVIVVCTALYFEIGLMGYLYAREQTAGNILNNFASSDLLISVGRVGLGFTCCCSFPLLVLPCRAVGQRIITLIQQYRHRAKHDIHNQNDIDIDTDIDIDPHHTNNIDKGQYQSIRTIDVDEIDIDGHTNTNGNTDTDTLYNPEPENDSYSSSSSSHSKQDAPLQAQDQAKARAEKQKQKQKHKQARPVSVQASLAEIHIHPKQSSSAAPISLEDDDSDSDTDSGVSRIGATAAAHAASIHGYGSASGSASGPGSGPASSESWFVSDPSLVFQTLAIVGSAFCLSTLVSSVAMMWSLLGSTVSIIIAYIIPAACYLKIRGNKRLNIRLVCAWLLLLLGVCCLVVCTYQAVASAIQQHTNNSQTTTTTTTQQ